MSRRRSILRFPLAIPLLRSLLALFVRHPTNFYPSIRTVSRVDVTTQSFRLLASFLEKKIPPYYSNESLWAKIPLPLLYSRIGYQRQHTSSVVQPIDPLRSRTEAKQKIESFVYGHRLSIVLAKRSSRLKEKRKFPRDGSG